MLERVLRRLGRVTNSGRFLAEIDGLRFIAIMSVIVAHVGSSTAESMGVTREASMLAAAMDHGVIGVQVFFAISGFILALPFAEHYLGRGKKIGLGDYYKRRVLRIEPPYIICMCLLVLLALLQHGADRLDRIPHLIASLLYVHNFVYDGWSEINFVAWSLEVEVQFYVLAPFLALVFAIKDRSVRLWIIIAALLTCSVAAATAEELPFRIRTLLPFQLQYFLAGFLLAEVYIAQWNEKLPKGGVAYTVIAAIAWTAVFVIANRSHWQPVTASLIFVAFYTSLCSGFWRAFLANRWVCTIGGMCYTIYLFHFWILSAYGRPVEWMAWTGDYTTAVLLNMLIGVPVILIVSAALFVTLEKPFMRRNWPSRLRAWMPAYGKAT